LYIVGNIFNFISLVMDVVFFISTVYLAHFHCIVFLPLQIKA
jgi:hypothetical protein